MARIACILLVLTSFVISTNIAEARPHHRHHYVQHHHHSHHHFVHLSGSVVGGRPDGCPSAFCGCGASLYLFGKIIEPLNRAAEWIDRFPRTQPAPMMAAARRHHVMVLMEHKHDNVWLVHDSNYGHRTLIHERDISGYVVVNPQGAGSVRNYYFADARQDTPRTQRMVRGPEFWQGPMLFGRGWDSSYGYGMENRKRRG